MLRTHPCLGLVAIAALFAGCSGDSHCAPTALGPLEKAAAELKGEQVCALAPWLRDALESALSPPAGPRDSFQAVIAQAPPGCVVDTDIISIPMAPQYTYEEVDSTLRCAARVGVQGRATFYSEREDNVETNARFSASRFVATDLALPSGARWDGVASEGGFDGNGPDSTARSWSLTSLGSGADAEEERFVGTVSVSESWRGRSAEVVEFVRDEVSVSGSFAMTWACDSLYRDCADYPNAASGELTVRRAGTERFLTLVPFAVGDPADAFQWDGLWPSMVEVHKEGALIGVLEVGRP